MMRAAAIVLPLLSASVAAAQPSATEPSSAADADARALFELGRDAYRDGRYRAAAAAFESAFELSGRAELLFNAGNAWDRAADATRALTVFRRYLAAAPRSALASRVRDRVAHLDPPAVETPVDAGWWLGRRLTWVAAATAVVATAVATALWVDASSRYGELQAGCGATGGCSNAELGSLPGQVTAANVALGVALASTGGAVTLWFVEAPDDDAEPRLSGAGIAVQGTL